LRFGITPPLPSKISPAFHGTCIEGLPAQLRRGSRNRQISTALPFAKTIKGYWKLRIGDYRVVNKIGKSKVWILGIQHRKTVHEDIQQRISEQP
jgi:hypothetical protein